MEINKQEQASQNKKKIVTKCINEYLETRSSMGFVILMKCILVGFLKEICHLRYLAA